MSDIECFRHVVTYFKDCLVVPHELEDPLADAQREAFVVEKLSCAVQVEVVEETGNVKQE